MARRNWSAGGSLRTDVSSITWPEVNPSLRTTSVWVSSANSSPSVVVDTGANAAGTSLPPRRSMVICCSIGVPLPTLASSPSARRSGSPSVGVHCVPSKFSSAISRQYDAALACTVNTSTLARVINRERMSTSGLSTWVVSLPLLRVSNSAPLVAPGRRGASTPATSAATEAQANVAGSTEPIVRRPAPIHAESSRAWEKRSTAITTMAVPIHSAETMTRLRSVPSAEVKTNTTPAGTTDSARP